MQPTLRHGPERRPSRQPDHRKCNRRGQRHPPPLSLPHSLNQLATIADAQKVVRMGWATLRGLESYPDVVSYGDRRAAVHNGGSDRLTDLCASFSNGHFGATANPGKAPGSEGATSFGTFGALESPRHRINGILVIRVGKGGDPNGNENRAAISPSCNAQMVHAAGRGAR